MSHKVGSVKPEEEIFEPVIDFIVKRDLNLCNCLYFDDYKKNVLAAIRSGIPNAYWLEGDRIFKF